MSLPPAVAPVREAPYDLASAEHDYPEWDGAPRRTILVCSHPRSGSTLLGEALYFAGLGCPLEYFHRGFRPAFERRWGTQGIDALTATVHRLRTDPNGVLGVKLFWLDVEEMAHEADPDHIPISEAWAQDTDPQRYRDIWARVAQRFPNPVFVQLYRRDRLRQAASALTAAQSGRWRAIPGTDDTPARREVVYDYERMQAQLALVDFSRGHWQRFFEAIGVTPYSLAYEDLDRDYHGTVAALLRHLGSDAPVPPQRMRRQSDAGNERLVLQFLRDSQAG